MKNIFIRLIENTEIFGLSFRNINKTNFRKLNFRYFLSTFLDKYNIIERVKIYSNTNKNSNNIILKTDFTLFSLLVSNIFCILQSFIIIDDVINIDILERDMSLEINFSVKNSNNNDIIDENNLKERNIFEYNNSKISKMLDIKYQEIKTNNKIICRISTKYWLISNDVFIENNLFSFLNNKTEDFQIQDKELVKRSHSEMLVDNIDIGNK